ncbi:unnamed protein product [Boreogadus saida]
MAVSHWRGVYTCRPLIGQESTLSSEVSLEPSPSPTLALDALRASSAEWKKVKSHHFHPWLGMKEEDISSKSLKRFRRFILDKEKQKAPTAAVPSSSLSGPVPSETVVPPSASASASVAPPTATSLSPWQDDTLFSEALATFEGQADTAMAPPPDPPQQPQTDPVPPSQEPPSGPRKRTSKSAAWHRETLQTVEDEDDEEEVAADTEESTEAPAHVPAESLVRVARK